MSTLNQMEAARILIIDGDLLVLRSLQVDFNYFDYLNSTDANEDILEDRRVVKIGT